MDVPSTSQDGHAHLTTENGDSDVKSVEDESASNYDAMHYGRDSLQNFTQFSMGTVPQNEIYDEVDEEKCRRALLHGDDGSMDELGSVLHEIEERIMDEEEDDMVREHEGLELEDDFEGRPTFASQIRLKLGKRVEMRLTKKNHVCTICFKRFAAPNKLRAHINSHTGERPYQCDHCLKFFSSKDSLRSHERKIHRMDWKREHKCPICEETFHVHSLLKIHMDSHCEDKPYKCNECSVDFQYIAALRKHVKRFHSPPGDFNCRDCEATFATEELLRFHEMDKKHGEIADQLEQCPFCTFRPKRAHILEEHVALVHETGNEPVFCVCGVAFATCKDLVNHCKRHGCKTDLLSCSKCGEVFITKFELEDHRPTHDNDVTVKNFQCQFCEAKFAAKSYLRRHMRRIHLPKDRKEDLLFKCEEPGCKRSFICLRSLKTHLLAHARPKKLPQHDCEVCGKVFHAKNDLRSHMRIHTGEKPFICKECGDCFKQRGHLSLHLRTHTGEKPYQCDGCDKAFTTNSALKKHKRTHSETRPFVCPICPARFQNNMLLKSHLTKIHNNQYPCEYCDRSYSVFKSLQRHIQKLHQLEVGYKNQRISKAMTVPPAESDPARSEPMESGNGQSETVESDHVETDQGESDTLESQRVADAMKSESLESQRVDDSMESNPIESQRVVDTMEDDDDAIDSDATECGIDTVSEQE